MSTLLIRMKSDWYGAISAVSFTDSYIDKVNRIYDYVVSKGHATIQSIDIQNHICGVDGPGKSDIRSTISLLKKLGFVRKIEDSFDASTMFTASGHVFVLMLKSRLREASEAIREKINRILERLICLGISYAISNGEEGSDNMKTLLLLFKRFESITWDEYLYSLYLIHFEHLTHGEVYIRIEENRRNGVDYSIVKDADPSKRVDGTSYLYNQNLLLQSGTISKISSKEAKLRNRTLLTIANI